MVDMSNRSNVHMGLPAQSLGNQNQMNLTSTSLLEKETQIFFEGPCNYVLEGPKSATQLVDVH